MALNTNNKQAYNSSTLAQSKYTSVYNFSTTFAQLKCIKGIVHFEIKIGIYQLTPRASKIDRVSFFSSVDPILMFLGQTVLVCQSYNGRYRFTVLYKREKEHAQRNPN